MKYSTPSQYTCLYHDHSLLQYWVVKLLQLTQKERPVNPGSLSEAIVMVFGEQASLVVDVKNPDSVQQWLSAASLQTRYTCFDEADSFCLQNRQLAAGHVRRFTTYCSASEERPERVRGQCLGG